MQGATSIVIDLHPSAVGELGRHLVGGVLALRGCAVELVTDDPERPRSLHAIVTWERAVPLKVVRITAALLAAGGTLRRDLDADGVRHRAIVAGHHVVRLRTPGDLGIFRLAGSPAAGVARVAAFRPAA